MSPLERWSWGRGAVDAAPPIASEGAGRRARELALRLLLEALSDDRVGPGLWRHFAADDAHAHLTRLLSLLREFVANQLPRLLRAVRCETADRPRLMREPAGGRVDAVASLRRAAARGSDAPDTWVLVRRERLVDTPVNRLVVAQLRDLERRLSRGPAALALMDGERTVLARARGALARFFAASPLGALDPPRRAIERLRAEARLRRDEYGRVAPFDAWWRALDDAWLAALRIDGVGLDDNGCYELCAGLGLALALRRRMAAAADRGGGPLCFHDGSAVVELHFGRRSDGTAYGRPATATLFVTRGEGGPRRVVVEARNQRSDVASDTALRLTFWLAQHGGTALLLTPEPGPAEHADGPLRWRHFLGELARAAPCDPVDAWRPLLDEILTPETPS